MLVDFLKQPSNRNSHTHTHINIYILNIYIYICEFLLFIILSYEADTVPRRNLSVCT